MPDGHPAKGKGDGGHEIDRVDANKRAEARASSTRKGHATGPTSSSKRAAPAGANMRKAAKKSKTSASASQVRREWKTAVAKVARADC